MKVIAVIEIPEGGKGKWYIDGEIRYTENESLMKKFDEEMVQLKPMPNKRVPDGSETGQIYGCYVGWNACIDEILGETE